eukprot:Hpha_TRINITY_DN13081_c0_g1::TRINITY_DN13081_c0_g1_i1::g.69110::m.69110
MLRSPLDSELLVPPAALPGGVRVRRRVPPAPVEEKGRQRVRHYTVLGWDRKIKRSVEPPVRLSPRALVGPIVSAERVGAWLPGLPEPTRPESRGPPPSTALTATSRTQTPQPNRRPPKPRIPPRGATPTPAPESRRGEAATLAPPMHVVLEGGIMRTKPMKHMGQGEARALYHQLMVTSGAQQGGDNFSSLAIWAEMVLVKVFSVTKHMPGPNKLRTAVCCGLLRELCNSLGSLRGVLNVITCEIFNSLYHDHDVDLVGRLGGDDQSHCGPDPTVMSSLSDSDNFATVSFQEEFAKTRSQQASFIDLNMYAALHHKAKQRLNDREKQIKEGRGIDLSAVGDAVSNAAKYQAEAQDLRRSLLHVHFTGWRKTLPKYQKEDEGFLKVIDAQRVRLTLQSSFLHWRSIARLQVQIRAAEIARRLGVKRTQELVNTVGPGLSMEASEIYTGDTEGDGESSKLQLPSQWPQAKRDKCMDGQGTVSAGSNRNTPEVGATDAPVVVDTHPGLLQMTPPGSPPSREWGADQDIGHDDDDGGMEGRECVVDAEMFLMSWVRNRLYASGSITGEETRGTQKEAVSTPAEERNVDLQRPRWPPRFMSDLGGDALTEVMESVGAVGTDTAVAGADSTTSAQIAVKEADKLFPGLGLTVEEVIHGSPLLPVLVLAFFAWWLPGRSAGAQQAELRKLFEGGSSPSRCAVFDALRCGVAEAILATPLGKPTQPVYTNISDARVLLSSPQVTVVLQTHGDMIHTAFSRACQSASVVQMSGWQAILGKAAVTPRIVPRSSAVAIFLISLPSADDFNLGEGGTGLNEDEFAEALSLLALWQPDDMDSENVPWQQTYLPDDGSEGDVPDRVAEDNLVTSPLLSSRSIPFSATLNNFLSTVLPGMVAN